MNTPLGTPLRPYQDAGVRMIRDWDGRVLLCDDPGLGKTVQILQYVWRFLPKDPPGAVVVVGPAHSKRIWERISREHFGFRIELLEGQRVDPDKLPLWDNDSILAINYEILTPPAKDGVSSSWKPNMPVPKDSWLAWLLKLPIRLLISDEGHALSNPLSARTRAVRRIARNTKRVIIATGTPVSNRVPSLWALLNILDPEEYPSYFDYVNHYCFAEESFGETIYKGARNLDHLNDRLKGRLPGVRGCLIRRRKEDVLADLPPIRHEIIPIEVDLREYRTAEINFLLWLENEYNNEKPGERQTKARSRLGFLKRLAARLKLRNALAWIDDFLQSGNKLLLGVVHYFVSGALMEKFGDRAVLVDGRLTDVAKHAGFNRFNTDPTCELCVGNVLSAGSAWSCTSTSDSALLELPWRFCELDQFQSRTHGIGRGVANRGSHLRIFVAEGTIEEDIVGMIQEKHDQAAEILDGGASEEFNLDDLIFRMKSRHGRKDSI